MTFVGAMLLILLPPQHLFGHPPSPILPKERGWGGGASSSSSLPNASFATLPYAFSLIKKEGEDSRTSVGATLLLRPPHCLSGHPPSPILPKERGWGVGA